MLHCVVHLYYVPGSEKRDILRCACFKDMYGMEDLNKKVGCLQRRWVVYRGGGLFTEKVGCLQRRRY